ncbi:hypothetical protein BGZ96_001272 [Linnemannia gamsii]|uniref:N-acetylglucosaminylphosphatidylinositol deacetylase n=1 Tax=Linnemannia gamsii TaxID=64522 RepID=A0ABQ7JMS0_9FUNG|nr:hypothetical protein BGZ96_001272 [Linnemannia gamsii]
MTLSSFIRPPYTAATTRTASLGSSSGTGVQRATVKRHQHYRFQLGLCTAATLGLILLGHPGNYCYNDQSNSYYCNGVYALPVKGGSPNAVTTATVDTLPAGLQPHAQLTQPHQQQQQVLALHNSNSATFSTVSAVISEFVEHIRLALPKHTSLAADDADIVPPKTVENSNNHNHITFATANEPSITGMSSDMGRVLASELISEPKPLALQDTTASITSSGQKQDEQHLAFLDLVTRVTGKSGDLVEKEIWKERRAMAAAAKKELEMRLKLHRKQDNPKSEKGEKHHRHKGKEARGKGKERHGLKGALGKHKGSVKATSTGHKGGFYDDIKTTPTIFYVPHQDDDALAMSLAIREHLEAGRKVIVHLYSDGINALLRDIVAGDAPCPLHHPPHKMNLTLQDVVTGRTHEFRQSLRALGVKDENIFETGWSDIEPLKEYDVFQRKLRDLILGYERKYPGASHKCISGEYDRDSSGRNPTHRACWDVATQLLQEYPRGWPASRQLWDLSAQFIRALPQFLRYKQKALDQYKRWAPSKGELAWGYHSVKALIDAAYYDSHLYMDMLDNDPTNPVNLKKGEGRIEEHGMFPAVWRSGLEKNTNKMLLEEQEEQLSQVQEQDLNLDLDDELIGLHRKTPNTSTDDNSSTSAVPYLDVDETKWDDKEVDMRLKVLKAYDNAAQRPEGKEYHDSIRAMAGSEM